MATHPKVSPFQDFREELIERGASVSRQSGKQVKQTATAVAQQSGNFFLELLGIKSTTEKSAKSAQGQQKEIELRQRGKFTQLDIEKIKSQYESPEEGKMKKIRALLSHYHQLQKGEEKKALQQHQQYDKERAQKFQQEEEQKKRKQQNQKPKIQAPKGKERRSIFGKVKKKITQIESKASFGKQ